MSGSTFSKFLWASGKPTCSCHSFYTNRRFPVCGYRHLAEKNWGCRRWQYYYLPRTVNFWGCRRKRRNCQSYVTADPTNPRYIYIYRGLITPIIILLKLKCWYINCIGKCTIHLPCDGGHIAILFILHWKKHTFIFAVPILFSILLLLL